MTDPEYFFDGQDPSDYRLFGIRYLILPAGNEPPVPARLTLRSGPYWLWTIDGGGYVRAGQIVGTLPADRATVGIRSVPLLHSGLGADGAYVGVRYGSDSDSEEDGRLPTAPRQPPGTDPDGGASARRGQRARGHRSCRVPLPRLR
jgi:hypothetical protein